MKKKEDIEITRNWTATVSDYIQQEPIATVLALAKDIESKMDMTVLSEMQSYFVYSRTARHYDRDIRGPSDYEHILEAANSIQRYKDRVGEFLLFYKVQRRRLYEMLNECQAFIELKPEVIELKNEKQRNSVSRLTMNPLYSLISKTEEIVETGDSVISNLNMTYYILASQAKVLDQIMFKSNLTGANSGSRNAS